VAEWPGPVAAVAVDRTPARVRAAAEPAGVRMPVRGPAAAIGHPMEACRLPGAGRVLALEFNQAAVPDDQATSLAVRALAEILARVVADQAAI
jgi:hypothetical protein